MKATLTLFVAMVGLGLATPAVFDTSDESLDKRCIGAGGRCDISYDCCGGGVGDCSCYYCSSTATHGVCKCGSATVSITSQGVCIFRMLT